MLSIMFCCYHLHCCYLKICWYGIFSVQIAILFTFVAVIWYWLLSLKIIIVGQQTKSEGAQTSILVAASEDLKDVSGKYFEDCKVSKSPSYISYIFIYFIYLFLSYISYIFSYISNMIGQCIHRISITKGINVRFDNILFKEFKPSPLSQDEGIAKKLWEISERLVQLQPHERTIWIRSLRWFCLYSSSCDWIHTHCHAAELTENKI